MALQKWARAKVNDNTETAIKIVKRNKKK